MRAKEHDLVRIAGSDDQRGDPAKHTFELHEAVNPVTRYAFFTSSGSSDRKSAASAFPIFMRQSPSRAAPCGKLALAMCCRPPYAGSGSIASTDAAPAGGVSSTLKLTPVAPSTIRSALVRLMLAFPRT